MYILELVIYYGLEYSDQIYYLYNINYLFIIILIVYKYLFYSVILYINCNVRLKLFSAPGMQKSRSSTNIQQGFMSKRIWKGRSKSQTRTNAVTSPWAPLVNVLALTY